MAAGRSGPGTHWPRTLKRFEGPWGFAKASVANGWPKQSLSLRFRGSARCNASGSRIPYSGSVARLQEWKAAIGFLLVCERCGCRMVAKTGRSSLSLVCVDCGHPANPRELEDRSRRSWRAAFALVAFTVLSGLILSIALLQEYRNGQGGPEPDATEQLE